MITIKTMSNIADVNKERRLPISLIKFLEETFKELPINDSDRQKS